MFFAVKIGKTHTNPNTSQHRLHKDRLVYISALWYQTYIWSSIIVLAVNRYLSLQ